MQNIDFFQPVPPILIHDMIVDRDIFHYYFHLFFGWPESIFVPLQGGSLTHLMLVTALFLVQLKGHRDSCDKVVQSLSEPISRVQARNIPILSMTPYPNVLLLPN